jgi:hypothetical protein
VHLVDPGTGAILVQSDTVPRRWTYPTVLWKPGEVIVDALELSLEGIAKGQYLLQIGLYDAASGERLSAHSPQGDPYPDDIVPLTTVER